MWKWSRETQCISNNIHNTVPGIQGSLHSDLKLSKWHFMLLYFPLFTLHFSSYLPLLEFAECFPLLGNALGILSTWNTLLFPETFCENSAHCSRPTKSKIFTKMFSDLCTIVLVLKVRTGEPWVSLRSFQRV